MKRKGAEAVEVAGARVIRRTALLEWDEAAVASALAISPGEVREYFIDGRRMSFVLERRLCREILRGTPAPSEGARYDILDAAGEKWEVRAVTKSGVYFCPSYMVGSGRKFEEDGFLEKLQQIRGYLLGDIVKFPRTPVWEVSCGEVRRWYDGGQLGAGTKISRARALRLLGGEGA